MSEYIPIEEAFSHQVSDFLSWPKYDEENALARIDQLKRLEVKAISLGGPHSILGKPILGKGHSGIVIRALYEELEVALKILRTDSDRVSMRREACFLKHANKWNVGPKLYAVSDDFLVMELLIGEYFGEWVANNLDNIEKVAEYILAILDIAWRLDQSGLDHGELTRIRRHYIVTETGPRVIDFESASFERPVSNLTNTVQSLFLNYRFSQLLGKVNPIPDRDSLIAALREYKKNPVIEHYQKILRICNLKQK